MKITLFVRILESVRQRYAPPATLFAALLVAAAPVGRLAAQDTNAAAAKPERASATEAAKKVAKPKADGPREGSKTALVVAMLQRKNGAALVEIMDKMGWQKHTVRGFMAGAMKKAGYTVESFKPEGGERTYRIK